MNIPVHRRWLPLLLDPHEKQGDVGWSVWLHCTASSVSVAKVSLWPETWQTEAHMGLAATLGEPDWL